MADKDETWPKGVILEIIPEFKPGDPPPSGYVEWQEWAKVQHRAGIRQRRCQTCGLWRFPQERCCEAKEADLPGEGPEGGQGQAK